MTNLPNHTNVLLLTIDALRADRLGLDGYRPSVSPNLDRILGGGLTTTNLINGGGMVTQFAFPSIFTSTYTLDGGGYDFGIRDRSASFVETLSDDGYETAAFCPTGTLSRHYGYARGFDAYHHLTDLTDYVYIFFTRYVQYNIEAINAGQLTLEAYLPELIRELQLFYAFCRSYCDEKVKEIQYDLVPRSPLIHRWNFEELDGLFATEQDKLHRNSAQYAMELLKAPRGQHLLNEIVSRINTVPRYPSTAYLLDATARWLERRRRTSIPFMAWVHVLDVHEKRFTSFDRIVHEHEMVRETDAIIDAQRKIHDAGEAYKGDAQYDFSVAYVDHCVGTFVTRLKEQGLLADTLLVITADHGLRGSGHPFRTKEEADVADFVDDYVRVPLSFVHPDIDADVTDTVCSSVDIAPTILSLLGRPTPPSFRGDAEVILQRKSRPHTLSENLGRGLCLFDAKPVRVAVRTSTHKLVIAQHLDAARDAVNLLSFHALESDPDEKHDLLRRDLSDDEQAVLEGLLETAMARIHQVRDERGAAPVPAADEPSDTADTDNKIEYGESALLDGDGESALATFRDVLRDEPNHPGALNDAGLACLLLDRRDDAVRYFAKAVDADASFEIAFYNLLEVLIEDGDTARASAVFEKLDASIPQTPEKTMYREILTSATDETQRRVA